MPQRDGSTAYDLAVAPSRTHNPSEQVPVSRPVEGPSRRRLFAPHAADTSRLRHCPICQWAVEQDHAEALAAHANGTPALSPTLPPAGQEPECDAQKPAAVVDFALV